jgi:hypothetical protein
MIMILEVLYYLEVCETLEQNMCLILAKWVLEFFSEGYYYLVHQEHIATSHHCSWLAVAYGKQSRDHAKQKGHAGTTTKYKLS